MKKIIYSLFICLAFVLSSCEDETSQDTSKITYFVDFEMLGDQTTLVPVGTPYTEAGVIATEGGNDITSSMVVSGSVDSDKIGLYTINYAATNVDGFASSISRTVIVYNPEITTDMSGTYVAEAGTYRFHATVGDTPYSGYNVTITQLAPGFFYVTDFFAGYYDVRAGYGSNYAMTGYIELKADNSVSLVSSKVGGWGDSLGKLANAQFNPETGALTWDAYYTANMIFYVKLKK